MVTSFGKIRTDETSTNHPRIVSHLARHDAASVRMPPTRRVGRAMRDPPPAPIPGCHGQLVVRGCRRQMRGLSKGAILSAFAVLRENSQLRRATTCPAKP